MIEKMNNELESILHKKYVILSLLQNATLKKDTIPIPVNLHRYLYGFSNLILTLCSVQISNMNSNYMIQINFPENLKSLEFKEQPINGRRLGQINLNIVK
jgi:hypothetical protein